MNTDPSRTRDWAAETYQSLTGIDRVPLRDLRDCRVDSGRALVFEPQTGDVPIFIAEVGSGETLPLAPDGSDAYVTGSPEARLTPTTPGTSALDQDLWTGATNTRSHADARRTSWIEKQPERQQGALTEAADYLTKATPDLRNPRQRTAVPDPVAAACRGLCGSLHISVDNDLSSDTALPSLDSAADLLERQGISSRFVKQDYKWYRDLSEARLMTFNGRIVWVERRNLGVVAHDPASGSTTRITARNASEFGPAALEVIRPVTRPGVWNLLKSAADTSRLNVATVVGWALLGGLLGLPFPLANDIVFGQIVPQSDWSRLWVLFAGLVVVCVLAAMAAYQVGAKLVRMRGRLEHNASLSLWDRLLRLPVAEVVSHPVGDTFSRAASVAMSRSSMDTSLVASTLLAAFSLVSVTLLFTGGALLGFVALGLIAVEVTIFLLMARRQADTVEEGIASRRVTDSFMLELINSIAALRVAGGSERALRQWSIRYSTQTEANYRGARLGGNSALVLLVWPTVVAFAVTAIVFQLGNNEVTAAQYLMFTTALAQVMAAVAALAGVVPLVLATSLGLRQSDTLLAATPEESGGASERIVLGGNVRLDHVTFRYSEGGPTVLDDVSFKVHPGEFVALVGPSGAGKSSVLRLLLGFELPEGGSVHFEDADIARLDLADLRSQIGTVLQSSRLMPGSIAENISAGADLSDDQLWAAARAASIADDIQAMPMGMNTVIASQTAVSGGQRQRIVIARALARGPALLLFDEATSALDNENQAQVTEAIDRLGITRIVIAHRLSTVRNADRVIVMQAGRVVEEGTPADLMASDGVFAAMARRQLV